MSFTIYNSIAIIKIMEVNFDKMILYEIEFANEYTESILSDISDVMKMNFEISVIEKAMNERDTESINNLIIINEGKRLICVDCNDKS